MSLIILDKPGAMVTNNKSLRNLVQLYGICYFCPYGYIYFKSWSVGYSPLTSDSLKCQKYIVHVYTAAGHCYWSMKMKIQLKTRPGGNY